MKKKKKKNRKIKGGWRRRLLRSRPLRSHRARLPVPPRHATNSRMVGGTE